MIYNIIKEKGYSVITNNTGANLFPGIVTTFVENYKFFNKAEDKYAVIEVDEANLKFIKKHITIFDRSVFFMSGNDKKEIERREKIDKTKEEIGEIEDTTKYGEFVSSYFAWLTLDRQKKTARKLENITKKNNKE